MSLQVTPKETLGWFQRFKNATLYLKGKQQNRPDVSLKEIEVGSNGKVGYIKGMFECDI